MATRIRKGKKRPFNFTPVDIDGQPQTLERPAIVTVSDPAAEILDLSADGLTGFIANRSTDTLTAVNFNIKGDGTKDNQETFNIEENVDLELVGADAIGLTGGFGEEVDI